MSALLDVRAVTMKFGGLRAVDGVNFSLQAEELVGLIGPNGAGKTTLFNLVTGVYALTEGDILFDQVSIRAHSASQIVARGIARTFQNIRLFPSLSVLDNVRTAMIAHSEQSLGTTLRRGARFHALEESIESRALDLLKLFDLDTRSDDMATSLSYGDQRRLEIVRALATRPRLLLLDEPAAGMNAREKSDLMQLILFVRKEFRLAILIVEHDMRVVMGICDRICVFDYGRKIAEGSPASVRSNPQVIAAYLGSDDA